MNLRAMLVLGGVLLIGTGCPHDWMKGGTNDRAMAKDTREMLQEDYGDDEEECPDGMTPVEDCEHRLDDGSCPVICQ